MRARVLTFSTITGEVPAPSALAVVATGAGAGIAAVARAGPDATYGVAGTDGATAIASAEGEGRAGAPASAPSPASKTPVGAPPSAEAVKLDRAAHAAHGADVLPARFHDEVMGVAEVLLLGAPTVA